jgi:hypothetical protein
MKTLIAEFEPLLPAWRFYTPWNYAARLPGERGQKGGGTGMKK